MSLRDSKKKETEVKDEAVVEEKKTVKKPVVKKAEPKEEPKAEAKAEEKEEPKEEAKPSVTVKQEAKAQPNVRIKLARDVNTIVGNEWYRLKKGETATVPANVKEILKKAGCLEAI